MGYLYQYDVISSKSQHVNVRVNHFFVKQCDNIQLVQKKTKIKRDIRFIIKRRQTLSSDARISKGQIKYEVESIEDQKLL